jgi:hypothetical protein
MFLNSATQCGRRSSAAIVSLAAVDGDEQAVGIGQAVREAGWGQVPWVNGNWPPVDQIISIRLTRAQWRFAADEDGRV